MYRDQSKHVSASCECSINQHNIKSCLLYLSSVIFTDLNYLRNFVHAQTESISTRPLVILVIPHAVKMYEAIFDAMCGSRKYPYAPHGRSLEIFTGRWVSKVKLLDEKYEGKIEFPGGCGGAKHKTSHVGSMDTFWNYNFKLPALDKTWKANLERS